MKKKSTFHSILWIGSTTLIAGLLNYIYHPLMLRFMSIETFGEFTAMLGIFNILGVITTGVSLFLVQKIAQAGENTVQLRAIFHQSFWPISLAAGGVFMIFLAMIPLIQRYLNIHTRLPLVLVGSSLIISFTGTVFGAFIQGKERFQFMGINSILSSAFKFVLGIALAYAGFQIYAAIGGLLGGGLFGLLLSARYVLTRIIHKNTRKEKSEFSSLSTSELWSHISSLGEMLLAVLLLSFFMNGDVILAKNLFDATTAGIYGAVSVVGKFIIFLGAAIETVYYPKIIQHSSAHQVPFAWLKNPSLLLVLAMIGGVIGIALLGPWILKLMKPELLGYNRLLVAVVLMCSLYGFLSLYTKILIAWKDRFANRILGGGGILLVAFVYLTGIKDLGEYVLVIMAVEFLIILLLLWRIRSQRRTLSPLPHI